MAFLDDLGRTISGVGQSTIQKTREMSDTMKYNSLISDEERAIKNYFTSLGELYYNEHAECAEGAYFPIVEQINECRSRISDYKSIIDAIKAKRKCPYCGASLSQDDLFCASCGKKVEKRTAAEGFCKNCGKPLNEDADFCIYCGTRIEKELSAQEQQERIPDVSNMESATMEMVERSSNAELVPEEVNDSGITGGE